jgi:TolA-binding protein
MSDAGRDLGELKHEVVEARNQAIKTDNQIKNLSLDIRGFEKRFDALESRVRLAGIGVNLIVALTIVAAAYVLLTMRGRAAAAEMAGLQTVLSEEKAHAQAQGDAQQKKLTEIEKRRRQHEKASDTALQVLTLLDSRRDKEAGDLLDTLVLADLTTLERKSLEPRFGELRQRQAEASYRSGRMALAGGELRQGTADMRRVLALDPEGRFGGLARYQLAQALWAAKRYDEAEPVLRTLVQNADRRVAEEAQYLLAATLARLDKREEAKASFARLAADSRFSVAARAYAAALEAGGELPIDLPGGRVRLPRKTAAEPAATAEAAPTP